MARRSTPTRRQKVRHDPLEDSKYREHMSWARKCLERALDALGELPRKRRIATAFRHQAKALKGAIEEVRELHRLIPRFDYSDVHLGLTTTEFVAEELREKLEKIGLDLQACMRLIQNSQDVVVSRAPEALSRLSKLIRLLGALVGDKAINEPLLIPGVGGDARLQTPDNKNRR